LLLWVAFPVRRHGMRHRADRIGHAPRAKGVTYGAASLGNAGVAPGYALVT
jgi:hypothetical protein